MRVRSPVRLTLLAVPIAFMTVFLLVPLGLTIVVSFWQRAGLRVRPAFTLASYLDFFQGVRLTVLERSLLISAEATLISLFLAYPSPISSRTRHDRARHARYCCCSRCRS